MRRVLGLIPCAVEATKGPLNAARFMAMDLRLEGMRIATETNVHVEFWLSFKILVSGWSPATAFSGVSQALMTRRASILVLVNCRYWP